MSGKQARREIISGKLTLPTEIPEDVRDLITMLTQYNPQDRITYDGVKNWLKNPKCFVGCREHGEKEENGLVINRFVFHNRNGEKASYTDTYSLAAAINDNQELAWQQRGVILEAIGNALKTAPQQDPQLTSELLAIQKKYANDFWFCLFLTLHTLNPNLRIKFGGKEMYDFKDYINVLKAEYGKNIDEHFTRDEFLNVLLGHGAVDSRALSLIRAVIGTYKTPIDRIDMFLNLFGNTEKFCYDGTVYENLGEFLNQNAFSANGNPNTMKWNKMRNVFLTNYLAKLGADDAAIKSIVSANDSTIEYFMLGKVLNGYIPLRLCGVSVKNFHQFAELIASKKEANSYGDLEIISGFISGDGFMKIAMFEERPLPKDLCDKIQNARNKISYIYYFCHADAKFMGCVTVNELIARMGKIKSGEIEGKSKEILSSEDFKIWMEKQGVRI